MHSAEQRATFHWSADLLRPFSTSSFSASFFASSFSTPPFSASALVHCLSESSIHSRRCQRKWYRQCLGCSPHYRLCGWKRASSGPPCCSRHRRRWSHQCPCKLVAARLWGRFFFFFFFFFLPPSLWCARLTPSISSGCTSFVMACRMFCCLSTPCSKLTSSSSGSCLLRVFGISIHLLLSSTLTLSASRRQSACL